MASVSRRKNGLTAPHSMMQISTWITLPSLMIGFTLFCSPVLPIPASIPVTIVFWGLGIMCAYWGYKATVTDPMDKYLACTLAREGGGENNHDHNHENGHGASARTGTGFICCSSHDHSAGVEQPTTQEEEPTKYCWVCETDVAQHAMHCKYCDKCVSHFDHHCQWLNTCVGEANYPFFNKTLWSISLFLITHLVVMIVLVLDIFLQFGGTRQLADDWFGTGVPEIVAGINIFFILFDTVASILIVQLLLFHVGLQREGITTYQYILKDNQKKREKQKKLQLKNARRNAAINEAQREGRSTFTLKIGQYVSCCDPLAEEKSRVEAPSTARRDRSTTPASTPEEDEQKQEDPVDHA